MTRFAGPRESNGPGTARNRKTPDLPSRKTGLRPPIIIFSRVEVKKSAWAGPTTPGQKTAVTQEKAYLNSKNDVYASGLKSNQEVYMRIEVRSRSLKLTQEMRDRVRRRVQVALGRFSQRLTSVHIMLRDVNGPKGGVDKHCKVLVSIRPSFKVIIEEKDANLGAAVNRALDRAGRAVARRIDQALARRRA
jgi:ribosome-associated translation inhibitor RaiA